jgi:hypothetical protein
MIATNDAWRTLVLDLQTGLFVLRRAVWNPETGEFTRAEVPHP